MLAAIGCRAKNSVAPMTAGYVFMLPGEAEVMAQINLTNWGDTRVTSITYTLYYMDSKGSEGPVTVALDTPLEDGETRAVGIAIKAGKTLGKEDVLLNITQANGTYNEASVSYTYITRCTVNKMPVKRVLVEDYAAMWCWHCPVGLVATDALARRFPDDVVAVSVHKTDDISKVVSPTVYEGLIDRYAATLPAVWIARDNKAAGYDVTTAYQSEKSKVTYMNIGVSARWDATGDAIDDHRGGALHDAREGQQLQRRLCAHRQRADQPRLAAGGQLRRILKPELRRCPRGDEFLCRRRQL